MSSDRFFQDKIFSSTIILSMTLVAAELGGVIVAFCGSLIFLKWIIEFKKWTSPRRSLTNTLVFILLIYVLLTYRTLADQDAAYTFLLGLGGLKVLDFSENRDRKLLILIGFILVSAKALFSLDFYWLLPSIVAILGLWYSLLPPGFSKKYQYFCRILALSLPITFVLFVIFPRFILPWSMARGKSELGRTGFSNSLRPGDVAEIINDGTLVFRARPVAVDSKLPTNLYWKGAVLDFSEGLSWHQGVKESKPVQPLNNADTPTFEVVLESLQSSSLFVLDGTRSIEAAGGKILQFPYQTFRVVGHNKSSLVYRGFVSLRFRDDSPPTKVHLQTPEIKGRVLAFVKDVNSRDLTVAGKLSALQDFFIQNDFRYTLKPGSYKDDDLEEFLFVRRKGFCEHFSGAYATLARAVGIPSRVVVGYFGGQSNPYGQFLRMTHRDAHAWVEIFHDGFWQRVDPTTWIAPLRFEIGAEEFFALSESDQFALAKLKTLNFKRGPDFVLWKDFFYWIEDLNYRWTYFLIEFQPAEGSGIFRTFSSKNWAIFLFVAMIVFFYFSFFFFGGQRLSSPYSVLVLKEVEAWGEKRSLPRQPFEPPLSYFSKLSHKFPEMEHELSQVYQYFDQTTYAEKNLPAEGKQLLSRWRALSSFRGSAVAKSF